MIANNIATNNSIQIKTTNFKDRKENELYIKIFSVFEKNIEKISDSR